MGKGSSKAPKQKESKAEKERAKIAFKRISEWTTDGYRDLEKAGIRAAKVDHTERLQKTANADVQQALAKEQQDLGLAVGQGNFAFDQDDFSSQAGNILTESKVDAASAAEGLKDTARLNMAKVGQDVAITADNALSSAARRGASKATTKLQATSLRNRARTNALASVAAGAASGYALQSPKPKANPPDVAMNYTADPEIARTA